MTLADYVGREGLAEVFCGDHSHKEVPVKVEEVKGDQLMVRADRPWCDADFETDTDDIAWMSPLDDDEPVGDTPVIGNTEAAAYEVHADF